MQIQNFQLHSNRIYFARTVFLSSSLHNLPTDFQNLFDLNYKHFPVHNLLKFQGDGRQIRAEEVNSAKLHQLILYLNSVILHHMQIDFLGIHQLNFGSVFF